MPRARSLKPGFFRNEELLELSFETRLMFAGLWTLADRAGRLEDRPKRIKIELFPLDEVDIDDNLSQLQERGFIVRYVSGANRYIQVTNFDKHQNPHKSERDSTIPAPCEQGASTMQEPGTNTINRADSFNLTPDSGILTPDSQSHAQARENGADAPPEQEQPDSPESKDAELKKHDGPIPASEPVVKPDKPLDRENDHNSQRGTYPETFERFWAEYPSGNGNKKQAFSQWKRIKPSPEMVAIIMAGLAQWKACQRWQEGFVKSAEIWLRDAWFDNDPPPSKATSANSRASPESRDWMAKYLDPDDEQMIDVEVAT